jgi:micrococcal nuclease
MDKKVLLLIVLILGIFILNYSFLNSIVVSFFDSGEEVFIDRVIDGDTVVSNGTSIRLLGINAPERGEMYSSEATAFLESFVLNKTVSVKITGQDMYKRELAYLFVDGVNVNLELVRNGFANFYFPSGKDKYYDNFFSAWGECIEENVNLCTKSLDVCSECVELFEWDIKNQKVVLRNVCENSCDLSKWSIKDEGRKKFVLGSGFALGSGNRVEVVVGDEVDSVSLGDSGDVEIIYWEGKNYVWTEGGDTMFLRDASGGLVLWESY